MKKGILLFLMLCAATGLQAQDAVRSSFPTGNQSNVHLNIASNSKSNVHLTVLPDSSLKFQSNIHLNVQPDAKSNIYLTIGSNNERKINLNGRPLEMTGGKPNVKGRVLADGKPLEGVLVTDGEIFTKTGADGRYEMSSSKNSSLVYITTPSGYVPDSQDGIRPAFWQYLNLPYDQEEIHDFSLRAEDQSVYTVLFIADLHLTNSPLRDDIRLFGEKVMPLVRKETSSARGPVYTMNLGDFTHELYWYQCDFNEADGLRLLQDMSYPTRMYSVTGNHDHDGAIIGENVDERAIWLQRNCWGPGAYSVNIGTDHWIFLDDIFYVNVPGKGKKAPGIKGDRSYEHRLTDEQLAWLKADLSFVNRDTPVYICTHCPFIRFNGSEHSVLLPESQAAEIDSMASEFAHPFVIYAGHIHKFDFCVHPDYPHLSQRSYPASSGVMWETRKDWPLISGDGSDAGVCVAEYRDGKAPDYRFSTYEFGDVYFRVYDMNEVGKYYGSDSELKGVLKDYPQRKDYSKKEYRNMVFVNYWAWEPGDVVEILEDGKPLKVEMRRSEDPLYMLSSDLPRMAEDPRPNAACDHMFEARTRSAKSALTLRVTDREGRVRFEREIVRPVAFVPSEL